MSAPRRSQRRTARLAPVNQPQADQPYTRTLGNLVKNNLVALANELGLAAQGSLDVLRRRIRPYLKDHIAELISNPRYVQLYTAAQRQRHEQDMARQPSAAPSDHTWGGIDDTGLDRGRESPQPSMHSRASSVIRRTPSIPPRSASPVMQQQLPLPLEQFHIPRHPPNQVNRFDGLGDEIGLPAFTAEPNIPPNATPALALPRLHRRRPPRERGCYATSAAFIVPENIRRKFTDGVWSVHIPLTFLTDKSCAFGNIPASRGLNERVTLDEDNGLIVTQKPLSPAGELELSFDEWHQAWRRLLDLIRQYLPEEYDLWEVHYQYVLNKEDRSEMWQLYLAYDTEVRRRACYTRIDPSIFHIGIWNGLEPRYLANQVHGMVQQDRVNTTRGLYSQGAINPNYRYDGRGFREPSSSFSRPNQPPPAYSTNRSQPPRAHRCFLCGDRSQNHTPRNCTASRLFNGKELHIKVRSPNERPRDTNGNGYCFRWNSTSCQFGSNCRNGEHWCSLCGNRNHGAQNCTSI